MRAGECDEGKGKGKRVGKRGEKGKGERVMDVRWMLGGKVRRGGKRRWNGGEAERVGRKGK